MSKSLSLLLDDSDYQAKQEANKKTVTSQVDLSALSNYGADLSNETEK